MLQIQFRRSTPIHQQSLTHKPVVVPKHFTHKLRTSLPQADGTSTLALRFTQARFKDGKVIAIKATIVGVAPPADPYSSWPGSNPSVYWNNKILLIDQKNVESGVNMQSAIASMNSAVFVTTKKDDVKLPSGAQLSLAIAARGTNHQHAGRGATGAGVSRGA